VTWNTAEIGCVVYALRMDYQAQHLPLFSGAPPASWDSMISLGEGLPQTDDLNFAPIRWICHGRFSGLLEKAHVSGAAVIFVNYQPNLDAENENDIMAGRVVSEAFTFLAQHPGATVYLSGSDAYEKWARRLDGPPDPTLWAEVTHHAQGLMTYDIYPASHRERTSEAFRALSRLDHSALCWRVMLEHLEHFLCGRVELPHDCSRKDPYQETVREQLLTLLEMVRERPAWESVLNYIDDAEILGPGSIYSVPVLREVVSGAQTLGALGLVGLVCACEAISEKLPAAKPEIQEKRAEALSLVAGIAAIPAILGWSAVNGACGAVGRGYVRWQRKRGQRIPPTRFSSFQPGYKPPMVTSFTP
jgi:hypothetical protein